MTETGDLFTEIAALAVREGETSVDKITPQTRLASDLGLDGDDAGEFMDAYVERFGVDLEDFHWLRYFGDEGWDVLRPVLVASARAISPRFDRQWRAARNAEREITIAHLVEVAQAKRWRHPEEGQTLPPHSPVGNVIIALMALPIIAISLIGLALTFAAIAEMLTGAGFALTLAVISLAMTGFPILLAWASWRNIQRKLASAA